MPMPRSTFKVVKHPFYQVLPIHAFVRRGRSSKQLPLVFCLVGSRSKYDYQAVLKQLLQIISDCQVQETVLDYEPVMWSAIRDYLDEVGIKGCVFHWVQAVYKKLQEKGLAHSYRHEGTHFFCRRLMELYFLPAEFIPRAFHAFMHFISWWVNVKIHP